ncbi:MAG: hypothetical protein EHM58_04830 [Ignavibacteriae bacterium]|nr:MAG: hypothetical protein EHM58_04830 [Ignavibacteriota bacterium]
MRKISLVLFFTIPLVYSQWTVLNPAYWSLPQFRTVDFFDANYGMTAGDSGRIQFTSNGGISWVNKNCYSAVKFNSIKALSQSTYIACCDSGKMLRTTNYGDSWTNYGNLGNMNYLCLSFPNNMTGYCGGIQNLMKTTNGGVNWQLLKNNVQVWSMYFLNTQTGWLSVLNNTFSLFKTTNGGISWDTNINTPNMLTNMVFINEITGWAVSHANTFLKTTNSGTSWEYVNANCG